MCTAAAFLSFLSTLSLRRATTLHAGFCNRIHISIHALLAESDQHIPQNVGHNQVISIHALLAESDRRTGNGRAAKCISIHALLAESDGFPLRRGRREAYFYPRSPCGERPVPGSPFTSTMHFYPRSPCGERLEGSEKRMTAIKFLSTLSLRRATVLEGVPLGLLDDFYPRSPCGERPAAIPAGRARS